GLGSSAHRVCPRVAGAAWVSTLFVVHSRAAKDSLCRRAAASAFSAFEGMGLCGSDFQLSGSSSFVVVDGQVDSRVACSGCICSVHNLLVVVAAYDTEDGCTRLWV